MEKLVKHYERINVSNETDQVQFNISNKSLPERISKVFSKVSVRPHSTWICSDDIDKASNQNLFDSLPPLYDQDYLYKLLSGFPASALYMRHPLAIRSIYRDTYRKDFTVLYNGYSLSPYVNFKNRFNIDNWIFENESLLRSNNMVTPEIERKLWIKKERDFFMNHPVYKRMPPGHFGVDVLIQKLTKVLFRVIREHLG